MRDKTCRWMMPKSNWSVLGDAALTASDGFPVAAARRHS